MDNPVFQPESIPTHSFIMNSYREVDNFAAHIILNGICSPVVIRHCAPNKIIQSYFFFLGEKVNYGKDLVSSGPSFLVTTVPLKFVSDPV